MAWHYEIVLTCDHCGKEERARFKRDPGAALPAPHIPDGWRLVTDHKNHPAAICPDHGDLHALFYVGD